MFHTNTEEVDEIVIFGTNS